MEKVASLSDSERRELFQETAARRGMAPAIAEKDFWVCWVLKRIYEDQSLSRQLMFKGGTSLSKVFRLIERFSEDIDLILDWRAVAGVDLLELRSNTRQQKLNQEINAAAQRYISEELLPRFSELVGPVCSSEADDGFVINIRYPASFADGYLRPEVRLEIGPLASWLPWSSYSITPYAAEIFPDVFNQQDCRVKAIKAERTFWEKATILHQEAHRPEEKPQPPRYSRHYYDLYMMAKSSVREIALANLMLLENVVDFKRRFYPRAWAHYERAKPGSFRLIPEDHVLRELRKDYQQMEAMIYGEYPVFEDMMEGIAQLEDDINASGIS